MQRIDPPAYQAAIDKTFLATTQYSGMANYQHRLNDHLMTWYAQQYTGHYEISSAESILELGCGDGSFWTNFPNLSHTTRLVLTDLAPGMLAASKSTLTKLGLNAEYGIADMEALPFPTATFSSVIAHKVIYHAHQPETAIADIARVLKPDGWFGLSVLQSGAYGSIWKLAHELEPQIPDASLSSRFTEIEAAAILPKYFDQIDTRSYTSTRTYTTAAPVVEYVKTNPIVQPLNVSSQFFNLFSRKVDEIIARDGKLECEYNSNLYLCKKR